MSVSEKLRADEHQKKMNKRRKVLRIFLEPDLLYTIFSYFRIFDYLQIFCLVCKRWKYVERETPLFWKRAYSLHFHQMTNVKSFDGEKRKKDEDDSVWKKRFINRYLIVKKYGSQNLKYYLEQIASSEMEFEHNVRTISNQQLNRNHLYSIMEMNTSLQHELKFGTRLYHILRLNTIRKKLILEILKYPKMKWFIKNENTLLVKSFTEITEKDPEQKRIEYELYFIGPALDIVIINGCLVIDIDEEFEEEDFELSLEYGINVLLTMKRSREKTDSSFATKELWNFLIDMGININYKTLLFLLTSFFFVSKTAHGKEKYPYVRQLIAREIQTTDI